MTIVEYFDPKNHKHLRAYDYLKTVGHWDSDFGAETFGLEFPPLWQVALATKLADAYLEEHL